MKEQLTTSRRGFLKLTGIAGGGLMLGFNLTGCDTLPENPDFRDLEINAFILINGDGTVTIKAKNPDIGQGVKTSLPMILAEELDIPWKMVTVEQAELDSRLGSQFAGGSTGVKTNYENLRKAGAAVRDVIVRAAADQWGVQPLDCKTEDGFVTHGSKRLHYGHLAEAAAQLELNEDPPLKDPKTFNIIGKSRPDVDLKKIVTGEALYGIDQEIDGMVYATVLKPQVFGSKLANIEDSEAKAVPGVIDIFEISQGDNPGNGLGGVAIVAENQWAAFKAKGLVKAEWNSPKGFISSNERLRRALDRGASSKGTVLKDEGNVGNAFRNSDEVIEAKYHVPFISHSQMEPMNFIADVQKDKVLLIGPTQTPGSAAASASNITGVPREQVQMKFTRIGGGFGRRLLNDYANEAVLISQKVERPVKLVWTREADFLADYYRPAGAYHFKAALTGKNLEAMEVNICTTSRYLYRQSTPAHGTEAFPDQQPAGMIPNFKVTYSPLKSNIPVGALRTPGVNATTYAYQGFMDELAEKVGMDPIEFQLGLIGTEDKDMPYEDHGGPTYNTVRLRNVIELVREKANWGGGKSQGFAAQMIFGSYVACIVDASLVDGKVKVDKVNVAVDCGRVINPIGANAQVQGGITDAISAALYESLELRDGAPIGQNFDRYEKLRITDSPEVDVHFVASEESPQGLGEPSYPILFPALTNAVYQVTGQRIRELPLKKHNLV
ncbi:xanthine dehydrogenase family protein molybdopterin-binding subunit [Roseivirga sp. E12]|uniref:xanthine dehydrogenase family protein molybdopterin-binding subunit n=1 Tax=Roseivirga sp. E12 TaxID=2819237 RepID=UPI001ABD1666|nr:molybdopterin cofactor-binding domain-containing protein [Roseivirga sp. E12]MBO3696904.1 xanthine dehydrogenase family protein molybdopterin-binding subunit [Roseivirga sp. E12]